MRILIVPLPALAQTNGSQGRVNQLIAGFKANHFEVATCAALDGNFKKQRDVTNYFLEVPIPMGLPSYLGKNLFRIATSMGITKRKSVHSFEEVLFLTGALSKHYFAENIKCVREAIHQYEPDIVYSEFNLGTIVAAKLEKVKVLTNYSYPVQPTYACTPIYARGVNKVLNQLGLAQVKSALELFDLADYKIIPSSKRLEPIEGQNVIFTGPFLQDQEDGYKQGEDKDIYIGKKRNKIIAYMGTGTISPKRLLRELKAVFYKSKFEIYIAGEQLEDKVDENIHTAQYFNFKLLLPETKVMIHHGGQNSVMDALRFGVPQLICPGKVFERRYNAWSMVKEGAGIIIEEKDFYGIHIKEVIEKLEQDTIYPRRSEQLWREIKSLGGMNRVIDLIAEINKIR